MLLPEFGLGFWVAVPHLLWETYTSWRVLTLPFNFDGAVRRVRVDLPEVGVGLNSGRLIATADCLYENPRLCPAPIQFENNDYVLGILGADVNKLKQCRLELVKAHDDVLRRLGTGDIVVYTECRKLCRRDVDNSQL